jgi:hypothetical protein
VYSAESQPKFRTKISPPSSGSKNKPSNKPAYSSTPKIDAIFSSEMSVNFQRTTQRYIPEDRTLHNHRCENLNSYKGLFLGGCLIAISIQHKNVRHCCFSNFLLLSEELESPFLIAPWLWSASELYRPSDRRLLTKFVPTFTDRGCRVVSATGSHGR